MDAKFASTNSFLKRKMDAISCLGWFN